MPYKTSRGIDNVCAANCHTKNFVNTNVFMKVKLSYQYRK